MEISIKLVGFFLIGCITLGFGCIGTASMVSPIKDNFQEDQRFDYEIGIISSDNTTNERINLEIVVNKTDPIKKNLIYSTDTKRKKILEKIFIAEKANQGNTIKIISKVPVLHDIRPELPNLLSFPENFSDYDAQWVKIFNQSGEYLTTSGTIKYSITGTSIFTNIGRNSITTKSGTFECIGIKQVTNYSIKEALISKNETTDFEKRGNFNGENWIDFKTGILVKSSFEKHTINTLDLSETYKRMYGIEKMYREAPVDLHLTTELTSKNNNGLYLPHSGHLKASVLQQLIDQQSGETQTLGLIRSASTSEFTTEEGIKGRTCS